MGYPFNRRSGGRLPVFALFLSLVAWGCSDGGVAPEARTLLSLSVDASQVSATSGVLQIRGPENESVSISPGEEKEIELEPGSYSVALEGLSGSTVVGYWERNATVTAGQLTRLTVSLAPFVTSTPPSAAGQAVSGEPFVVTWSPVSGADSYDLQASTSPTFATVGDELRVDETSAEVTVTGSATVYFRVRARTRFNGVGNFGPSSSGTQIRIPVASVQVAPQDPELEVGQTLTFEATTRGPGGETLAGRNVSWSSTDPSVATINASTGRVTAVARGTTTIRATSEGVSGSTILTVVEVPASVTIEPGNAILAVGGTVQLSAVVRNASGQELSGVGVSWSSDNTGVAQVDGAGLVTGVAAGSTIIRAAVDGVPGITAEATVNVGGDTPPQITAFEVDFLPPVESCREPTGDFRTIERLAYSDGDGDTDPGRTYLDPVGTGPAQNIEVQFRSQLQTDWVNFNGDKRFTPNSAATGSSGQLDGNDPACFVGGDETLEYIDFRVRIQDVSGNWSDWFETRRWMPEQVAIDPSGTVSLPDQNPIGFTATSVIDFNGEPIPTHVVSWSNYVSPELATTSSDGVYTPVSGSSGGLDWIRARAAYADELAALAVPGSGVDRWLTPGWITTAAPTVDSHYRTRVYEGREYTFYLNPGSATSGDLDLFIRFGARASVSEFDASSTDPGFNDEIVYTAPADGVVWILVDIFSAADFGPRLGVNGEIRAPRSNEMLPSAAPLRPGVVPSVGAVNDLGMGSRSARSARDGSSNDPPLPVRDPGG